MAELKKNKNAIPAKRKGKMIRKSKLIKMGKRAKNGEVNGGINGRL